MDFKKGQAVMIDSERPAFIKAVKWNMAQVQYGDGRYEWVELKRLSHS